MGDGQLLPAGGDAAGPTSNQIPATAAGRPESMPAAPPAVPPVPPAALPALPPVAPAPPVAAAPLEPEDPHAESQASEASATSTKHTRVTDRSAAARSQVRVVDAVAGAAPPQVIVELCRLVTGFSPTRRAEDELPQRHTRQDVLAQVGRGLGHAAADARGAEAAAPARERCSASFTPRTCAVVCRPALTALSCLRSPLRSRARSSERPSLSARRRC
jgi:hypothetical protein